jgi:tetratricopeptide (TPR) repeat protein
MRIPFGKTSAAIIVVGSIALAQEPSKQPESGTPATSAVPAKPDNAANPSNPSVPPKAPGNGSDTSAALDYLMNRKPQDGSMGKQAFDSGKRGETKAIADDAVGSHRNEDQEMRARFERYLGTAPVPQETLAEYFTKMKQVSTLLRDKQIFQAWKQLHDLGDYTMIDAGISRELANRIESIWNTDRASAHLDQKNDAFRKDVKTSNRNADMMSGQIMDKEIEYQRRLRQGMKPKQQGGQQNLPNGGVPQMPQDGGNAPQPSVSGLEGKLQLTEEYLRSLELKARIKLNELKQEKLLEQAKTNFSEYISALYNSGRLNHVVLAADFYRKIFEEAEYPVEMAKQVNASLEIQRDVQSAIEVFRYKADRGQLSGASDSLQTAFMTNELSPAVLGLERPLKEKVADFNAGLDQMRNLIEARDFGNLEILLQKVKQTATDFDTTKPMAIVNGVKLESKMRLGKAKLAAQQGDLKLAMEEFQAAAEAWPGNPALEDKAGTFFDTQDMKSQALVEFDRLVEEQNYRAIFDKQLGFAPAIKGDTKREEALKTALLSIKDAEMASEKANVLMLNGDFFGAWETIELASTKLPDDKKLNKLRADLSGRSAEFVSAINKARDAEGRNEIGFSITWFVNAQRQYPASQIANQGIERLSKKLLEAKM